MKDPDLLRAVNPVVQVFDELAIPYYISGSIASSVYGLARSTIDVFALIDELYPRTAMDRRHRDTLSEEQTATGVYFCSAEDIIIHKLQWHEAGGRVSEHQWLDVLGVIKVQADSLDKGYLQHWSQDLGIFELLERAFAEAGVPLQP
jgi:hypothetical protein